MREMPNLNTLVDSLNSANGRHAQLRDKFTRFARQAEQLNSSDVVPGINVTLSNNQHHFVAKFLDRDLCFTFSTKLTEARVLMGVIRCCLLKEPDDSSRLVGELVFKIDGETDLALSDQDGDFAIVGNDVHTQRLVFYFIHESLTFS
jgi:hypothetical protein